MLLRHSLYYLCARGGPGLLNVAALAIYTRLLAPAEFGRYVLVIAVIGLAEALIFQWIRLVLARFLPAQRNDPGRLMGTVAALFLGITAAAAGVGLGVALYWPDPVWQRLIALAVPLLVTQAWFELNLTIASTGLDVGRYTRLITTKAVLAVGAGGSLAWIGLGAHAPLTGLLAGQVVAVAAFGLARWRNVRVQWPERSALRAQLTYGLPLALTLGLGALVATADRLLLQWFLGVAAVGAYAAGYDLAQQSLGLLLATVNTAAYPLAVHALERDGVGAAREQLAHNGALIISLGLGGAAGLSVIGPALVGVIVGAELRDDAARVLPWIALGAALSSIKAFHFDIAFHLARRSRWLVGTGAAAVIANVVLSLLLIPRFGLLGAAWASVAAFATGAAASAWFGRRVFQMPSLIPLLAGGLVVALAAAAGAWLASWSVEGAPGLVLGLGVGTLSAAGAAYTFDIAGLRHAVRRRSGGAGAASGEPL